MIRALFIILALLYLSAGLLAAIGFSEEGPRPQTVAVVDFLCAAVALWCAYRSPRYAFVILGTSGAAAVIMYLWASLSWSAGHDGPGLAWLYVAGPLHVMPLLVLGLAAVVKTVIVGRAHRL
jgi:hypothetical protein